MIYVFKTSVKTKKDVRDLQPRLNELLPQSKWSFDLDDCDKILRIDSQMEITYPVVNLLQDTGFECQELPN